MMKEILTIVSNINYWEDKPDFDFGFIRRKYTKALWKSFGNKLIKVVVGQRRTGKSYIVRQLINKLIY